MRAPRRAGRPRAAGPSIVEDPRQDILRHAARLIAGQGFAGTSTRQIAAAAGLRQPSLFHYFPKKQDLLQALIDEAYQQNLGSFRGSNAGNSKASTRLREAILNEIEQADPFKVDLHCLIRSPEVRYLATGKALSQKVLRSWRKVIVEGQSSGHFRDGDPTMFARFIVGLIDQAFATQASQAKRSKMASETADFILDGLKRSRSR